MGTLEKIWVKRMRRGPMDERSSVLLVAGSGIEGNADRGGKRQVTILQVECWNKMMAELGVTLEPSTRRANLLVSGIDLCNSSGRLLRVGPCLLRVIGETRPCERMDEAFAGLRASMEAPWCGGAFAEVVQGGQIRRGGSVEWEQASPTEKRDQSDRTPGARRAILDLIEND